MSTLPQLHCGFTFPGISTHTSVKNILCHKTLNARFTDTLLFVKNSFSKVFLKFGLWNNYHLHSSYLSTRISDRSRTIALFSPSMQLGGWPMRETWTLQISASRLLSHQRNTQSVSRHKHQQVCMFKRLQTRGQTSPKPAACFTAYAKALKRKMCCFSCGRNLNVPGSRSCSWAGLEAPHAPVLLCVIRCSDFSLLLLRQDSSSPSLLLGTANFCFPYSIEMAALPLRQVYRLFLCKV